MNGYPELPTGFEWETDKETLPTLLNPETGRFEPVVPSDAALLGIPIGPPVPSGREVPVGGLEMPGGAPPPWYGSGPSLWASTESGVPQGYVREDPPAFTEGLASTFGYNDPMDTGMGAWGDNTNDPNAYGVSLPRQTLIDHFGDEDEAQGALVEITNPATGRTTIAPIVDKGPADWVVNRQGPTIDVTEGVRRDLGNTGLDAAQWRILPKLPEGYNYEGATTTPTEQAQPTAGAGLPQLPEGFTWEQPSATPSVTPPIIDAVDPNAPYMSKPRDPSGISRIILHGDVNQDADSLIQYGRQVDPARGFAPGYHFYVARDGTVKQGAPIDRVTNHTLGENADSIGIVVAGADEGEMPTPAQEAATKGLIAKLGTDYNIDPQNVMGHGELQPNRRHALEGGHIASDIRTNGYGGQPAAAPQQLPELPEGYTWETPQAAPQAQPQQPPGAPAPTTPTTPAGPQPSGPVAGFKPEVGLQEQMLTTPATDLPTMSTLEADRFGLQRWRDAESGMEVRRAGQPEVRMAEPAGAATPSPTPLVAQKYAGKTQQDLEALDWLKTNPVGKEFMRRTEFSDTEALEAIRSNPGVQTTINFVREFESGGKKITQGAEQMLAEAFRNYRNEYKDATPEQAAKAIPQLEALLAKERSQLEAMRAGEGPTEAAPERGRFIPGTNYPMPPMPGGPQQTGTNIPGTSYPKPAELGTKEAQSIADIARMEQQLHFAKEAAQGRTAEPWRGQISRAAGAKAEEISKQDVERRQKYEGFVNKAMAEGSGYRGYMVNLGAGLGSTAPSLIAMMSGPGGVTVGTVAMATQEFQGAYDEYKDSMKQQGKPVDPDKAYTYARNKMLEQVPFEAAGNFTEAMILKNIFKEIPAALLRGDNPKLIAKYVAQQLSASVPAEALTEFQQTLSGEITAEKAGLQAPTTMEEKVAKAGQAAGLGAGQALVIGAAGTTAGVAKATAANTARDARIAELVQRNQAAMAPTPAGPEAAAAPTAPPAGQAPTPAPTAPAPGTPAALAAEKQRPPDLKDLSQLPQGLGTQPETRTPAAPTTPAAALAAEKIPTPVAATTPAGAAPTTPAATATQPTYTPEQEAEVQELMARYTARGGAFGRGAPVTQPTTPTGAAPKPQGIIGQFLGGVRKAVLGKSQYDVSQEASQRHYKERQILSDQRHRDPALWQAEIEEPMRQQAMESPVVKALGADIEFNPGMNAPMAASYSPSGKLALVINPVEMQALENSSGNTGQAFSFYLGEELDHFGEIGSVKDTIYDPAIKAHKEAHAQWVAGGQQGPAPQPKYAELHDAIVENRARLFVDMRSSLKSAPPSEQRALYQAAVDAYNVYFAQAANAPSPGSKGLQATAAQADKIFAEISSRPGGAGFSSFVAEFTRQARQQRNQGNITESVWRKVLELIKGWYRQSLDRLQQSLPGVQEGKFGEGMQRHVQNIEDFLSGKGVEIAPPGAPTTWQKGGAKGLPSPIKNIVNIHNTKGGSTVNAVHGDITFTNAYSVSIFPELGITSPGKRITEKQIADFDAKLRAAGVDTSSPNFSIGTWYDAKSDTTYIDAAITTSDRAQAIALGKQFNQKAVYDLGGLAEISTGGTGVAVGGLPSIQERVASVTPTGYTIPYARPTTEEARTAYEPGAPPDTYPGGRGATPQELGGIQPQGPRGLPKEPKEKGLTPQPVTPAKLRAEIRSDPGYVYHATNLERLYEIAESGKLKTHKPNEFTDQDAWPDQSTQKRAYFSRNAGIVWSFAPEDGTPVVVRSKSDPSLGTERSTGDIYSVKPVSANKLEYLGEDDQWHPVNNLRPKQSQAARGIPKEPQKARTPELKSWLIGQEAERLAKLKGDQYTKATEQTRKAFSEIPEKQLGINVIEDPSIDEIAFVGINELDGLVTLVYNPHKIQARENISFQGGRRPGEAIDTVIDHELAHAAEHLMAKDQGIELEELHQRLYDDITKTVAGAPKKQQTEVYQTLIDSYDTYFGEHSEAPPLKTTAKEAIADPSKLFGEIDNKTGISGWMSEFARQAHEAAARGDISEGMLTKLLNILKGWFTAAVDRLRSTKGLPGVTEGKFGSAMQKHVQGIKEMLKGRGVSFEPSRIPLTDEQIDAMAREGEAFKDWYSDFRKELDDFLGRHKEYAPLIMEFLASTSPQEGIEGNVRKTVENFIHYVETGKIKSTFQTHADNLKRAVLGQKIRGPKVGEYSPALHGDPFTVTMDRHMFEAIFGDQRITEARRKIGTDAVFRAAARLGWNPTQVQAAMWGAKLAREGVEVSSNKTYGNFLEQYRQQLEEIFRREAIHGGRGREAARRAAAGISERAGPERAARQAAFERAREGRGLEKVKKPKPESAEAEARRYEAGPAGIPAAATAPAGGSVAPDARITRHIARLFSGARDVFRRSPGLEYVGDAITRQVDIEQAMKGDLGTSLVARGILHGTKRGTAYKEFKEYVDTWLDPKKGKVAADALGIGNEAQRLVDNARESIRKMKDHSTRLGMTDGPKGEFPTILSNQTMNAIENPAEHQSHWNRLKDDMVRDGLVPKGTPDQIETAARILAAKVRDDYLSGKDVTGKLPTSAYDHGLLMLTRYVNDFAKRASLKEAFGSRAFFAHARTLTTNEETKNYLTIIENHAFGSMSAKGIVGKMTDAASTLASGFQLGNPESTSRNLLGGIAGNVTRFGIGSNINPINVIRAFAAIKDGKEKGILLNDFQDSVNQANKLGMTWKQKMHPAALTKWFTGTMLKAGGYNAAETFVRAHGMVQAKALERWSRKQYKKNPKSRGALQFLGLAKRLGFGDPEALIKADGNGPLYDIYLRRIINRVQGGYTYADVTAFLASDEGGFIQKYGKWGSEHLNMVVRDVIAPFIRGVAPGSVPETVTVTNPATGKKETMSVPGEYMPLLRYALVMAAVGQGWEWIAENIFGKKSQYASWAEIGNKLSRGDRQAIGDAMAKTFLPMLGIGFLGALGDRIRSGVEFASGKRTLDEFFVDLPIVGMVKDFSNEAQDFFDREDYKTREGWMSFADKLATKTWSYYRSAKKIAGVVKEATGFEHDQNDAIGWLARESEKTARIQDRAWVRATGRRFDAEMGIVKPRPGEGSGPTAATAIKERLWDHIMLGEVDKAQALIDEQSERFDNPKDRDKFMKGLEASIRNKQPINAAGGGEAGRVLFNRWADENLPTEERARLERIDQEYRETATQLGLMKGNKHVPESEVRELEEALLRARERNEADSPWGWTRPVTNPAGEVTMEAMRRIMEGKRSLGELTGVF